MEIELLIGGQAAPAEGGRTYERRNPISGALATRAAAASVADAERAAAAAAAAFPAWSGLGPHARREALNAAAEALLARSEDIVAAMADEIGATQGWARFNLMLAAGMIREAAALTTQVAGEVIPSEKPGCLAMAIREPAGVVLGIAPWNAPVILGVRAIATPLACGNTVVLKASETCPRTHLLVAQAFQSGLPAGAVNLVTNAPADAGAVVGALIDHPAVRRINFTGSTRVGRIVAERAARRLKPVLLELGGKAPLVVLEDADLDEAVKAAAFGAFMNQGQICMSTERIIVVDAIADEFVKRFAEKAKTLTAGDPRTGQAPLGAVVDQASADHVRALIEDAVGKGAVRAAGEPTPQGVLLSAAVVDRVTPTMRLYSEESFGPVVAVLRVKDEAEAVATANDTDYGLSAAVFTRDIARGLRVARQIQSGICHINGPTVHDEAQMPFGGVKASGYGRFGGKAGIAEFTELRWITVETQPGHFPI
jgi:benzaldehyde dehydrogenase (NAD)